jgi:hypothetical protein
MPRQRALRLLLACPVFMLQNLQCREHEGVVLGDAMYLHATIAALELNHIALLTNPPPPRAGLRAPLGLLGPAPRAGPSSRARRAAAGGHAPGSRPAPPRSAPRACAPGPGSSSCCLHLRAAPRRGRGTRPRLAARAAPLRVPGLLARAGFFKLASRGPHAEDPDPLLLFSAAGPMLVLARLVT